MCLIIVSSVSEQVTSSNKKTRTSANKLPQKASIKIDADRAGLSQGCLSQGSPAGQVSHANDATISRTFRFVIVISLAPSGAAAIRKGGALKYD